MFPSIHAESALALMDIAGLHIRTQNDGIHTIGSLNHHLQPTLRTCLRIYITFTPVSLLIVKESANEGHACTSKYRNIHTTAETLHVQSTRCTAVDTN